VDGQLGELAGSDEVISKAILNVVDGAIESFKEK